MSSWLLQLLDKNSPNPTVRLELAEQIIDQLGRNRLPSDAKTLNEFCDVTFQWMAGSNFKVSLQAIEVLNSALDISGDVLAPYLLERVPALIERLGDSKPQVRDAVTNLLVDLAGVPYSSPQQVLEKLSPGFVHKQWLVKCGLLGIYRILLDDSREELEIQTNRLIPTLCKLMADPNNEVRETSMNTIIHIMIILGETTAVSIRNRRLVPETKMQLLMQRYEEALKRGSVPSAVPRPIRMQRRLEPRAQSASVTRNGTNGHVRDQENIGQRRPAMPLKRPTPVGTPRSGLPPAPRRLSTGAAGAVTEDEFRKCFNDAPRCTVSTKEDVRDLLNTARGTMEDLNLDWSKRQNALKSVRSVVINGGLDFEKELVDNLRLMEDGLTKSITDLRSQVCKEACVTCCMLAEKLGSKLAPLFERIFPVCIPLIQNSAKVMATSGSQACSFIVRNVQTPKIFITLMDFKQSKSKEIRSHVYLLVTSMLTNWQPQKLEKHLDEIVATIKLALNDADPNARKNGREGYQQLEQSFPQHAQVLYKSLDPSKQKALNGGNSAASSSQSISSLRDTTPLNKRPGVSGMSRPNAFLSGRSASAIDANSVRRAASAMPKYSLASTPGSNVRRTPIAPLRNNNVSQPSSRNGSPTRTKDRFTSVYSSPSPAKPDRKKASDAEDIFKQINNLSMNNQDEEDWFAVGTATGATLQNALKKCALADPVAKKDGLKMVHETIRTSLSMTAADAKAITEALIKLLTEHNHKLVTPLTDTLCDLVSKFHNLINDQLFLLLSRLLQKYSQEIMPTVRNCFKKLLDQVRVSFGHTEQLAALCKFIDGQMTSPHTPKARLATVNYMVDLVSAMESGSDINRPEVQSALRKIFQWMEDPKNFDVKPSCEQLIRSFFDVNAADFSLILAQFPPAWKEHAFSFLQRGDGRRDSVEPTIERVTAGIEMADCTQATPSLGPLLNNTRDSEDTNMSLLESTLHLAHDESMQNSFIKRQLRELSATASNPSRIDEQHMALRTLQQMVSEGSFTTWNENFKPMLLQLFDLLSLGNDKKSMQLKRDSLRLITKLCTAQAARFYDFGQMVITRVLNVTVGVDDSWFLNVVDECLKTFSSHLPIVTVLSALNPIITSKIDPRIAHSLKMLQRLVEQGEPHFLNQYLAEFVPGVVDCYGSTESSVRKNTVFTLVALVNKLGREEIDPYLNGLEPKTVKLLDLYIQRTQTASTHF